VVQRPRRALKPARRRDRFPGACPFSLWGPVPLQLVFDFRSAMRFANLAFRRELAFLIASVFVLALGCSGKAQPSAQSAGAGSSADLSGQGGGIEQAGSPESARGGAAAAGEGPPNGAGAAAALTALTLTPAASTIVIGGRLQLVVTGSYADRSQRNLTELALFATDDPNILTISGRAITARSAGTTTVTASVGALFATASVTVGPQHVVAITVVTSKPTLAADDGTPLKAIASMADGTQQDVTDSALWLSSDPKVARLIQNGFVVAMGGGTATITATVGEISGSLDETVTGDVLTSFSISGTRILRLADTGAAQLYAHYGATREVVQHDATWKSQDPSVLDVSDAGIFEPVAPGTATVDAQLGTSVAASIKVVVTSADLTSIQLVAPASYEFCNPPLLKAVGTFSDGSEFDVSQLPGGWAYEDGAEVRSLSSGESQIVPKALGPSEIEFSLGDVLGVGTFTALLGSPQNVTVGDALSLPVSAAQYVSATAHCVDPALWVDVTSVVQWSSDDSKIAIVLPANDSIEVKGGAVGTASVHATYPGLTISPIPVTVYNATPTSLAITPESGNFGAPSSYPLEAYGTYADFQSYRLTSSCNWSTSNAQVGTISSAPGSVGKLLAVGAGALTITAKFGALTASATYDISAN
jgi:uncharacterized protein YjdB